MSYYFVGCDGVGKSTLEHKLQEKINYPIIKGSSFELAKMDNLDLFEHFINIAVGTDNVIVDRFAHCNRVYASIFNDYAILSDAQFQYVQSLLEAKEAIIVYVTADRNIIKNRLKTRGDKDVSVNQIDAICNGYDKIFHNENHKFKFVEVDTSQGITPEVVNYLASLA